MRIISGKKRRAKLTAPPSQATRPTTDRTRESIFNILDGGRYGAWREVPLMIDGFAGSGAWGLEAWSRGAESVIFIDNAAAAMRAITRNIAHLGAEDDCVIIDADLTRTIRWNHEKAGVLFLDPPWRESDFASRALLNLDEAGAIAPQALAIIEHDSRLSLATPDGWDFLEARKIGRAGIAFLRKI